MTNKIKIISFLLLLCASLFILSACDSGNSHTHKYDEWTTTKAATCTEAGNRERVCSCGEKQTQAISATGHSYGEWITTKAVTCTEVGEETRCCSCGDTQTRAISIKEHTYGEWTVIKTATCTEAGKQEKICSCGDIQTQSVPATGHSYGEWTTTKAATCTEVGVEEKRCACGDKQTQSVPAMGHSYGEWTTTKAATCTEAGVDEKCCSCGDKQTQTISALGHTFSAWNTTKEASCTQVGLKERTCYCGEKETDTIVASHAWKDATCTEAKNCSKCGLTDGAALGHTCSIGMCTRCSTTIYPTVNLPSMPMTVWNQGYCSMKITEISYKFDSSGNLIISFSGEKTYGKDGGSIALRYKVLDADGYVLYTDMWLGTGYNTGDKFKNETLKVYSSSLNGASEYTIVITDYN